MASYQIIFFWGLNKLPDITGQGSTTFAVKLHLLSKKFEVQYGLLL